MANTRTLRFLGLGYGSTPATITAAVNGNVVYNGQVPSVNQAGPAGPLDLADQEILFEYTGLPLDFSGNLPVTIQVTGGEMIVIGETLANFARIINKLNNTEDTSGAEGFVRTYRLPDGVVASETAPYDERSNVTIDGEPVSAPVPRSAGKTGTWFYKVAVGSTITFDTKIDAGRDY